MSGDFEEWRWSDPNGQQRLVRTDELRAGLASGVIPPNAPVWRHGWKEWVPAYEIPELTTSALAATNGILSNIPPPPLGVLGAQKDMEREALGPMRPTIGTEPPVPPRYVPTPTRVSQPPPSMPRSAPSSGRLSQTPSSRPAPVPKPGSKDAFGNDVAMHPPSRDVPLPTPSPSSTMVAEPVLDRVAASVDEANTTVVAALSDADAIGVLANADAPPGALPPALASTPRSAPGRDSQASIPTAVGVPALALAGMSPSSTLTPPPPVLEPAAAVAPAAAPPALPSRPPPLPKAATRPPSPAASKNKTLVLFGSLGATAKPGSLPTGTTRRPPPPNAANPEGFEEITGSALLDAPVSKPELGFEELSGSILLDAPEGLTPAPMPVPLPVARSVAPPAGPSDSVLLSESVRKVATVMPAVAVPPVAPGGTLYGFPPMAPPAAAAGAAAETEPMRMTGRDSDRPANTSVVHDLGTLLKPRTKPFYAAIVVVGVLVGLGATGLLIKLVRGSHADGEASVPTRGSAELAAAAPSAPAALPPDSPGALAASSSAVKPAAAVAGAGAGERCALAGASHVIAPRAVVPSGIEALTLARGIGLGFATSPKEGMAVVLDPTSLNATANVRMRALDAIRRVVPNDVDGKLTALAETDAKADALQGRHRIPETSIDLGVAEGSIVWAPRGKPSHTKLWALEGEGSVEALRGVAISFKGEKGIAVTYRRSGALFIGAAMGDSPAAKGPIFRIAGLGPQVGSPTLAPVGDAVLLAWADRASTGEPWAVRWVQWTPGETPHEPNPFTAPPGGLGEHMMSPSLAAVGGGRVLIVWTEGAVAAHSVRAQTLGLEGARIGEAFTISAEGVNAGQAQAAVLPDGRGVVAFLAGKGAAYEVVATPIACPTAK